MKRNTSSKNTAAETAEKKVPEIKIPEEYIDDFVKAMKIGYYKEFYKQGLITADQLERLIAMQNTANNPAAQIDKQ